MLWKHHSLSTPFKGWANHSVPKSNRQRDRNATKTATKRARNQGMFGTCSSDTSVNKRGGTAIECRDFHTKVRVVTIEDNLITTNMKMLGASKGNLRGPTKHRNSTLLSINRVAPLDRVTVHNVKESVKVRRRQCSKHNIIRESKVGDKKTSD
jgi:hypothetical protein